MQARFLALLLGAALVGGCGSHPHRDLGTEIDWQPAGQRLARNRLALPPEYRRIVIGTVTPAPSAALPPPRDDPERAMPVDVLVVRQALRDLLRESHAFDEVLLAEDVKSGSAPVGLVLETRLASATLRRAKENDSTALALGKWFFLGWICDWQHDLTYEFVLEPSFAVFDAATRQPFADVAARRSKATDALSLFERRHGAPGVLATVCWWPGIALDSDASDVARSLAPAALEGPARELLASLAEVRVNYRVADPVVRGEPGMHFELVSPPPNTLLAEPRCGVDFAVTVRPEVGRPQWVIVGGQEIAAHGPRVTGHVAGVEMIPGKPVEVSVVLDDGTPVPLAQISVAREPSRIRSIGPEEGAHAP